MARKEQNVVWITGASSGIGEACAYEFAKRGNHLILTSSSIEKLNRVANECQRYDVHVDVLPYDLEQTEGIPELVNRAWQLNGRIDFLFCNAGISQRTNIEDTSMEMIEKIMKIDFYAPVSLAQSILPLMLNRGGGHIAVTTSIAGRFGFPLRCGYSAAKHALYGFFETLQVEYSHKGIQTTIVCPGRVQTNISMNALEKEGKRHGMMDLGQKQGITSQKAASRIVPAIEKGKREILVGGKELIMVHIKRFFPSLCFRIARRIKPM